MSIQTDNRDWICKVVKDGLGLFSLTCSYTNRNNSTVTSVVCKPSAETLDSDNAGSMTNETKVRTFIIPRQNNSSGTLIFPPTLGVNIGDVVTYSNVAYGVDRVEDISGGYEAVFRLTCSRDTPTKVGVRGVD